MEMAPPAEAPPPPPAAAAPIAGHRGPPHVWPRSRRNRRRRKTPAPIAVAHANKKDAFKAGDDAEADKPILARARDRRVRMEANRMDEDQDMTIAAVQSFAPVRVFPVPEYPKGYDGPRSDFRETIYWNSSVQTNRDGNADVSFVANDAIT